MERVLKWNTEIKKNPKKHFGLRILGKSRACYPHGYDPHQLYDAVLVPSLCMTAKMRDVVHKMSGMPIPHSGTDIVVAAQTELHHPHTVSLYYKCLKSSVSRTPQSTTALPTTGTPLSWHLSALEKALSCHKTNASCVRSRVERSREVLLVLLHMVPQKNAVCNINSVLNKKGGPPIFQIRPMKKANPGPMISLVQLCVWHVCKTNTGTCCDRW